MGGEELYRPHRYHIMTYRSLGVRHLIVLSDCLVIDHSPSVFTTSANRRQGTDLRIYKLTEIGQRVSDVKHLMVPNIVGSGTKPTVL